MMKQRTKIMSIILILSVVSWQTFCKTFDVQEPWDSGVYWPVAYPVSILLSAVATFAFPSLGWAAGAAITFAQLPILLKNNPSDQRILFALVILLALSVLPMIASALASRLVSR